MSSFAFSLKIPPLLTLTAPPSTKLLINTNFSPFFFNTCILRATSRRLFGAVGVSLRTISTMEKDKEITGSQKKQLAKLIEEALKAAFPDVQPLVAICNDPRHGDYQCNNAMSLWNKIKGKGTQLKGPQPCESLCHFFPIHGTLSETCQLTMCCFHILGNYRKYSCI